MKALKACLALLAALALCLSLGLCASAETGDARPASDASAEAADSLADRLSLSYSEMSWDEIVERLLEAHKIRASVALGYRNLVTGEEHYYNGDDYMAACSMYKLPLCMVCTEQLASGELSWSGKASFESIRDAVLIDSSNEKAGILLDKLGGYVRFREASAEYTGVPFREEPGSALGDNCYTPREMVSVLRTLFEGGEERFPDILGDMQQALPERFFKLREQRFEIGHKAGWLSDGEYPIRDDCAIAFTSEPIAIVAFTSYVYNAESFLTDYCTAMCEYAEAHAAPASDAKAVPHAPQAPRSLMAPRALRSPQKAAAPALVQSIAPIEVQAQSGGLLPYAFVALFLVFGLIAVLVFGVKYRARVLGLLLALLIAAAAMVLSVIGLRVGTIYAKPSGDPAAAAEEFLSAVCRDDYDTAYRLLRDYSDLGLGAEPSTAAGRLVNRALHDSYAYTLTGPCDVNMLDAVQPLRFRYLDLPSLEEDAAAEASHQLELIVQSRELKDIYDENKHYLPSVTEEAYLAALDSVLEHAETYYAELDLELSLTYTDGRWQILTSPALLRALNGGTAY